MLALTLKYGTYCFMYRSFGHPQVADGVASSVWQGRRAKMKRAVCMIRNLVLILSCSIDTPWAQLQRRLNSEVRLWMFSEASHRSSGLPGDLERGLECRAARLFG